MRIGLPAAARRVKAPLASAIFPKSRLVSIEWTADVLYADLRMSGGKFPVPAAAGLIAAVACVPLFAAGGVCPREPVANISSSQIPADVCIPANFTDVATDY